MKNLKYYALTAIISLLVGRYVLQPEPKSTTEVKEKKQETEKKEEKKVIKSTKTKKPDGTETTETTVTIDTRTNKDTVTDKSTKIVKGKGITLGILAVKTIGDFQPTNFEAVAVVPFFGNLSIVGSANSLKQVGIGLALEF
jgi:uncharacterized membrane protein